MNGQFLPRTTGTVVPVVDPADRAAAEAAAPLPHGTIAVEPVPPAQKPQPMPLARLLMPLVMIVAVGGMVAFMIFSGRGANPAMLIFPLMMAAGMVAMISPPGGTDPDEVRRCYLRHLEAVENKADDAAAQQIAHGIARHPQAADIWSLIDQPDSDLWSVASSDSDAFTVRIAEGPAVPVVPLSLSDAGAPEDLDPVCALAVKQLVAAHSAVPGSPVAIQLSAFPVIGIDGSNAAALARAMLLHLAYHHGPEAVRIIAPSWSWTRWLPHTRGRSTKLAPSGEPWTIVVVTNSSDRIFTQGANCVIDVERSPRGPLMQQAFEEGIELVITDDNELAVLTEAGEEVIGPADLCSEPLAEVTAKKLTGFRRPDSGDVQATDTGFLPMLGIGGPGHLVPGTLWPPRAASDVLAVPFGVTPEGDPVVLDLKESAHGGDGPHGLCIGATGSGKSEQGYCVQ